MTQTFSAGFDPGKNGACALFDDSGNVVDSFVLPRTGDDLLDTQRVVERIRSHGVVDLRAAVERVWSWHGQGVVSAFTFGSEFGQLVGGLNAHGYTPRLVLPREWKTQILGTKFLHDKDGAIRFVSETFPAVSLLATKRSRTPHDGIAEAICIALWCHRTKGK